MTDRTQELGSEPIGRLLVRYSAPAMFAMFVNSLYNLVDTIFVGQGAGTLALAGLAVSFPIQMLILATTMMIGVGSASVISRSLGAGDKRHAERTAGTSLAAVGIISILVALGLSIFIEPVLRLFGATDGILPYATDYLSIILIGSFFFGVTVCAHNIARAEGNVKIAMTSMIIGAVVNVVLDPIFIFGLDMGIRGAALATIIANFCTFAFLCRYFMSGRSMLKIRLGDLKPQLSLLPEVFMVGSASFFQMIAGNLMAIPINWTIIHYGADIHLAIIGVANRAMMFFFMPIFGLTQGLQPIIGFNYGARNFDRVREAVRKAALFGTALSVGAFAILMFGATQVLSLFSSDGELVREGAGIVRILVIFLPFVGFQMVGGTLFQALGKARPALILTLLRQVIVLIPLIVILPRIWGLTGLWCAFPIADLFSATLTGIWVYVEMRRLALRTVRQSSVEMALTSKALEVSPSEST